MVKYVCAQPATLYYTWQVEVMINNFLKHGIDPNDIHILLGIPNSGLPTEWNVLKEYYQEIKFYFYNDLRKDHSYIPSLYFNLVKQHLLQYPELQESVLFTHDSDTIFTKTPNFKEMVHNKIWYVSNTNSYINYNYIQQKGDDIYQQMCKIVGIDPLIPKLLNSHSGGAQYLVKNTTFEFWDKVEKDSISLYKYFCEIEPYYIKKHNSDCPIQKWTAGMWSYLWNGWYFGNEILVDKRLDFAWSTDNINMIKERWILHNAGITDSLSKMFYKGNYTHRLPYRDILEIDNQKASIYYWNEICETAKISPLNKI